jgi:hypothetical protein
MSMTNDDIAGMLFTQLRELSDRDEVTRLCDRYVFHLDRDRYDDSWLGTVFTDDAQLSFPFGEYHGLSGIAEFQEMTRRVERTHHISANHVIELDGDSARVRAQLTAVHVPRAVAPTEHFGIGGHYHADLVRGEQGWRIRKFVFELAWQSGHAPGIEEAA